MIHVPNEAQLHEAAHAYGFNTKWYSKEDAKSHRGFSGISKVPSLKEFLAGGPI